MNSFRESVLRTNEFCHFYIFLYILGNLLLQKPPSGVGDNYKQQGAGACSDLFSKIIPPPLNLKIHATWRDFPLLDYNIEWIIFLSVD